MHLRCITALRVGGHRVPDALAAATAMNAAAAALSSLAILTIAAQLPAPAQALLPSPHQAFGHDSVTNDELVAASSFGTAPSRKHPAFISRSFDAALSPALSAEPAAFSPTYRFWPFHSAQLNARAAPVSASSLSLLSRTRKRFDVDAFTKRFDLDAFGDAADNQWLTDRRRKRFDYGFLPMAGNGYYNYYGAPSSYDDAYGLVEKRSRRVAPPSKSQSAFDESYSLTPVYYVGWHRAPADTAAIEQKRSRTFL